MNRLKDELILRSKMKSIYRPRQLYATVHDNRLFIAVLFTCNEGFIYVNCIFLFCNGETQLQTRHYLP